MGYTAIDMTGMIVGRLTVIERAGSDKKKQALFRCKCECGNEVVVTGYSLRKGETKSCGCLQRDIARENKSKDLSGKRIGHLFVIGMSGYKDFPSGRQKLYRVRCDCGNEKEVLGSMLTRKNHIQSCGCLTSEIITNKHSIDISGQNFGRLTALYPERTSSGFYGWRCRCICGNEIVTTITNLKDGTTASCGCLQIDKCRKNISGQKFGRLTVIDIAYTDKNNVYWNCICECGQRCIANGSNLRYGTTISCGCIRSKGENVIKQFLDKHNIKYSREKTFNNCVNVGLLKFDFWLPEYGMCIEFDGIQHYKDTPYWDKSSTLEDRQRRDAIKTKYCEENDIVLLRIPYWEKDNIESILSDWLFLNDAEEANSSDVDLSA